VYPKDHVVPLCATQNSEGAMITALLPVCKDPVTGAATPLVDLPCTGLQVHGIIGTVQVTNLELEPVYCTVDKHQAQVLLSYHRVVFLNGVCTRWARG